MNNGDITDDGWTVHEISIIYKKPVKTIKDYSSKSLGFKKDVTGWLYVYNLENFNNSYVILDNNLSNRITYSEEYFKILDTTNLVRKYKLNNLNNA